jgi:hypothetical protein
VEAVDLQLEHANTDLLFAQFANHELEARLVALCN